MFLPCLPYATSTSRLETASLEANREGKLKLLGPLTAHSVLELPNGDSHGAVHGVFFFKGGKHRETHQKILLAQQLHVFWVFG